MTEVCVFEGDDAAPEVVRPTVDLLGKLTDIEFHTPDVDAYADELDGGQVPGALREVIHGADTVLFGSASHRHTPVIRYLRWTYGGGTYANVRPIRHLAGIDTPLEDPEIDYVVVRENLEGIYVGMEGDLPNLAAVADEVPGLDRGRLDAEGRFAVRALTRETLERVAAYAADLARERDGLVTCATKSNVMPYTDGLFDEIAEAAAAEAGVEFEHVHTDAVGTSLVTEPGRFDVILAPNFAGDVLSDVGAGTIGGLGLAPSGCYGDGVAYFEPVHGTAPDIAGEGVINPTAMLLSGAMLLEYVGEDDSAGRLRGAVEAVYRETELRTPDLGGDASTTGFVEAVRDRL
jgi:isocitrate/isopropylmalate dehydrogenase